MYRENAGMYPEEVSRKESQTASELSRIGNRIGDMEQLICHLEDKLSVVLVASVPHTIDKVKPEQDNLVPLAAELKMHSESIQRLAHKLESMVERLEL